MLSVLIFILHLLLQTTFNRNKCLKAHEKVKEEETLKNRKAKGAQDDDDDDGDGGEGQVATFEGAFFRETQSDTPMGQSNQA